MEIIKDLVGHGILYFDNAVEIKRTPHTPAFYAWGVTVSPADELYIMDSNEEWSQLELQDMNAALVVGSLYQRLRMMRINYAKAS
jgi:hypothetical protein